MQDIEKKIDEVLSRGVGEFIDPDGLFRQKLIDKNTGKYPGEIIIKYGIDPTRPDIHLGHAVCLRKLRQLQDLGCKVLFLVGDFTALIGDPTGKSKVRPAIEHQEVLRNMLTYLQQVGRILNVSVDSNGNILDDNKFTWLVNSDWFIGIHDVFVGESTKIDDKVKEWYNTRHQRKITGDTIHNVSLRDFLSFLKKITHSRLIQRDLFQERMKSNQELYLHEMMYPVLQGLDSNIICKIYGSCDLEIGGTDQTFNMLMGRHIMEADEGKVKQHPQSVLSFELLEGLDGVKKMSKSLDNYIGITEEPNSMFLKVMSLPDTSIMNYFELCTNLPMEEIAKIAEEIVTGGNIRAIKMRLAQEIVTLYHSASASEDAKKFYEAMSAGENPENISPSQGSPAPLSEFIVNQGFATSKSDARRKIEQGGVEIDGEKIVDWQYEVGSKDNGKVMRVGKKDIVRIVFND